MTAPAPGTKEIEEVQPNRDLLFFMSTTHYSRWCANGGNVRRRALGGVPTVVTCGGVSLASIPGCPPTLVHLRQGHLGCNPRWRRPRAALSAQKPRFCARENGDCAREERNLARGSATVAFLQITAQAFKMQIPHNQTINF